MILPSPPSSLQTWTTVLLIVLLNNTPFISSFSPSSPLNYATTVRASATRLNERKAARDLIQTLVGEEQCFNTESGARSFAESCATNVVYEDCYEPQPLVGRMAVLDHMLKKASSRPKNSSVRIDKISDGNKACGFAWTWTCNSNKEEGLRGTTFVELNDLTGEIQYIREIPEPLYKPGDLTLELLKAVTADAEPNEVVPYEKRRPMEANDVVKYLFDEVQGQDSEVAMELFSEDIIYRDFNYEDVLRGKAEVKKFIDDFSFPGIEFRAQRYDDGVISTCFTWEVVLIDNPDTIKGISFYELDEETRLITYVRDVPESAIKPPVLGKIARQLRPGLGVFQGVKSGSRPCGM